MADMEAHPTMKYNWHKNEKNKRHLINQIYTLIINQDIFNHSYDKVNEGYQIKLIDIGKYIYYWKRGAFKIG